jgi:hypothetical protein
MAARKPTMPSRWFNEQRSCVRCGTKFISVFNNKIYCSLSCNRAAMKERKGVPASRETLEPKFCANPSCGIKISTNKSHYSKLKYCSKACQKIVFGSRNHGSGKPRQLSTGTIGAISELVICADLMKRGYHVFRAVSPSCPCDLLILMDGRPLRVEVTSGIMNNNGTISYSRHVKENFDMLAIVLPNGDVTYDGLETKISEDAEPTPRGL